MDIGIGLPNAIRGVDGTGDPRLGAARRGGRLQLARHARPLGLRQLRGAGDARGGRRRDRARAAGHGHPDRAAARHRDAGQAGGDRRSAVGRAARARPCRGRPRGRLRRRGGRLRGAWSHVRAPTRGDGPHLARRDRHRAGAGPPAPTAADRRPSDARCAAPPAGPTARRWAAAGPTRWARRSRRCARPGNRPAAPNRRASWRCSTSCWATARSRRRSAASATTTRSSARMPSRSSPARPRTPTRSARYVDGFANAGADEVIAFPANPDPAQVELLAEAVLG